MQVNFGRQATVGITAILHFSSFANNFTHMVNRQFTTLRPHPSTPLSSPLPFVLPGHAHSVCVHIASLFLCIASAWSSAKSCLVVGQAAYALQCITSAWSLAKPRLVNACSVCVRVASLFLHVASTWSSAKPCLVVVQAAYGSRCVASAWSSAKPQCTQCVRMHCKLVYTCCKLILKRNNQLATATMDSATAT